MHIKYAIKRIGGLWKKMFSKYPSFSKKVMLLSLAILLLAACSRQAVIVTADPEVMADSNDCFALLGTPIESGGPILKKLCSSDLDKIISFARIKEEHGQKIRELICSPNATPETFKKYFSSLTAQEKARLIKAFEFYGYNINGYGC